MQEASIVTRDMDVLSKSTGNIYQSIAIIGKRARQLSTQTQVELKQKLESFAHTIDNLEEIQENQEQTEISKFYEKKPKPASIAIGEFIENKIHYNSNTSDN